MIPPSLIAVGAGAGPTIALVLQPQFDLVALPDRRIQTCHSWAALVARNGQESRAKVIQIVVDSS